MPYRPSGSIIRHGGSLNDWYCTQNKLCTKATGDLKGTDYSTLPFSSVPILCALYELSWWWWWQINKNSVSPPPSLSVMSPPDCVMRLKQAISRSEWQSSKKCSLADNVIIIIATGISHYMYKQREVCTFNYNGLPEIVTPRLQLYSRCCLLFLLTLFYFTTDYSASN